MGTPASFVHTGIAGLAGMMAGAVAILAWRARSRAAGIATAAGILTVAMAQLLLASNGVLRHWDRVPPPFMVMMAVTFVLTIGLACSPIGARVAATTPLATLILFQAFRLPLEIVMHGAAAAGIMPVQMTFTGWNFDIVTGATAIVIGIWESVGAPRRIVIAWNLMGSMLLFAIVAIAVVSTPPIAAFGSSPDRLNTWVADPPYVWLPGILVPAALFGHIVLWRKLLR